MSGCCLYPSLRRFDGTRPPRRPVETWMPVVPSTMRRRLAARCGEAPIPIVAKRLHRVFWCPPRYRAIAAIAFSERRLNIRRDYAAATGYSVKGAWDALRSLEAMGLVSITTALGCRGWTRVRVSGDVATGNVSTTEGFMTSPKGDVFSYRRTLVETFDGGRFFGGVEMTASSG
jgi:hypothetical protein